MTTKLTLCFRDGHTEVVTVYDRETIEPAKEILFQEIPELESITEEAA